MKPNVNNAQSIGIAVYTLLAKVKCSEVIKPLLQAGLQRAYQLHHGQNGQEALTALMADVALLCHLGQELGPAIGNQECLVAARAILTDGLPPDPVAEMLLSISGPLLQAEDRHFVQGAMATIDVAYGEDTMLLDRLEVIVAQLPLEGLKIDLLRRRGWRHPGDPQPAVGPDPASQPSSLLPSLSAQGALAELPQVVAEPDPADPAGTPGP